MIDYPYMISNNKIAPILEKIRSSATPDKFTQEWLKQLGFASSNDRAFIPLLKKLGFITDDGAPTQYYSKLRDGATAKIVLADRIKSLYSEVFAVNINANTQTDETLKGIFSRVTGKDEKAVARMQSTFKALCSQADFVSVGISSAELAPEKEASKERTNDSIELMQGKESIIYKQPDFHYNIQIHLPATTEISVYNAIFKSLKENLLM